ncbi:hypothetical protein [Azospirillum sp. TSH7]|uniref:hypothetical protein n=1 Tax=Azospirillum sp. TSH7 TaxID=652751 RepID=UPI00200005E5|nr:hypothetical protein [Azospirillum sp. TSH7]
MNTASFRPPFVKGSTSRRTCGAGTASVTGAEAAGATTSANAVFVASWSVAAVSV